MTEVVPHVQSNLVCLKAIQPITKMADPFVSMPFSTTVPSPLSQFLVQRLANTSLQYQGAIKMVNESGPGSLSFSRNITGKDAQVNGDSDRYDNFLQLSSLQ
jgi:hypothetical protein